MISAKKAIFGAIAVAGLLATGSTARVVSAAGRAASGAQQTANPVPQPDSSKVVAGEVEAKKLLLLMDADKNGKVSKAEFMAFMAAEFERLDMDHNGELDVKELEQSQLATAHRGGTHR